MNVKKIIASLIALFLWVPVAIAQPKHFIPATKPSNLPNTSDFGELFTKVINYFIGLIGLIAVLMLVIGGIQYLASAGNEQTIEKAKHTILYAIIGIIIVVISYSLVYTLTSSLKNIVPAPDIKRQITPHSIPPPSTGGGLHGRTQNPEPN